MTQPQIFVFDDLHPEDNAMLQALYSRSPASVLEHREKVKASGSGKFMDRYYVGYGHASIGDCGTTTIFAEQVSMLVAKAIQSTPLYSGQEASTRYLDFSIQPQVDPYGITESKDILESWLKLYNKFMEPTKAGLSKLYPFSVEEHKSEAAWQKAIAARAFDILRCLLPCGTTTLLSWHTNLRQARDHLRYLKSHPLAEVQQVAHQIFEQLHKLYSHSFNGEEMKSDSERYKDRDTYASSFADQEHYLNPVEALRELTPAEAATLQKGQVVIHDSLMDQQKANKIIAQSKVQRPASATLPRSLLSCGVYNFYFLLDFGSYRDLQRHRNGYCPIPLIGNKFGFHKWYLNELEKALTPTEFKELETGIQHTLHRIAHLNVKNRNAVSDQYLYPMGMSCLVHLTYSLPQSVYVAELRSGQTVHGSLREVIQHIGRALEQRHPNLGLHIDYTPDSWSFKRGQQDITERKAAVG